MAVSQISGVRIAGIASAVPARRRSISDESDVFGAAEVANIIRNSGVQTSYIAGDGLCTSDLCHAAAKRLLEEIGWEPGSIQGLILITQTPDYVLPATACSLQSRLGLPSSCAAFDVNLGSSGYVYGLWLASLMAAAGGTGRVLLLVGDTISRVTAPRDRSVALIFGDAGAATALERAADAPPMFFDLGTDGAGVPNLIVPAGGFRTPRSNQSGVRVLQDDGNIRSQEDLYMNGGEIFVFTLIRVPPLIESVLRESGWTEADVHSFVFHQANRFILQHLAKRIKIPAEKVVLGLEDYGNTSSASIPLAMNSQLRERLRTNSSRCVLAGFGPGYSWGAAAITCGPMCVPEIIYLPEPAAERAPAS